MQEIIVNIAADGTTKVEARGVRGQGCAALTAAIEQALGKVSADVKKAEFFQSATVAAKQTAGGGK